MSGWGIKIDYAAAIADDESRIALYSSPTVMAISAALRPDEEARALAGRNGYAYPLDGFWFLFGDLTLLRARMAIAGLSVEDVACYLCGQDTFATGDAEIDACVAALRTLPARAAWEAEKAGEAIAVRINDLPVCFEAKRVEIVRKARASLARHRRNAAKWGAR